MNVKSYFGTAVQRSVQPLTQTTDSRQDFDKIQETDKQPEILPLNRFLFPSVGESDWGEVEITVSQPSRSLAPRRSSTSPDQRTMEQLSPPPHVTTHSESVQSSIQSSIQSLEPSKSSLPIPSVEKVEEVKEKIVISASQETDSVAQPIRPFVKTPSSKEISSKATKPSGKTTSQNPPPIHRSPSTQEATHKTYESKSPSITPRSETIMGVGHSKPSKSNSRQTTEAEQERLRVVLQPIPKPETSAAFPRVSTPQEMPKMSSPSQTKTPKLTIGRIEVEVVSPTPKPKRVASTKSSGPLSRDFFNAIGIAQM